MTEQDNIVREVGEVSVSTAEIASKPDPSKKSPFLTKKKKQLIFYCCMIALPVLQVCIFYIGTNINSILLAFRQWNEAEKRLEFVWFDNFVLVFTGKGGTAVSEIVNGIKNSVLAYLIGLVFSIGVGLPFANAIYKNIPGSGLFKVILYLPQVLSIVVMCVIFRNFTDWAFPDLVEDILGVEMNVGPLSSSDTGTIFATVMFFSVYMGFGTNMLLYTGAMSGINESVKEAAKIDGANAFQEFIHVTIPGVWPTMCTIITVGLAGMFVNQLNLFSFYSDGAPTQVSTLGYYLYKLTYRANATSNPLTDFPYLAAFGIVLTLVAAPLTLGARKLLYKLGPKAD